ncbi:6-bladed beta-propeller [bacterium]|nr:6-bladed beta-propeller [bacterium]
MRWSILGILLTLLSLVGCGRRAGDDLIDRVIGEQGLMPGQFNKPRAIAIDRDGSLAVVDFRAMIQWLTPDGEPITQWQTPTHQFGRPSGLGIDHSGRLLVADSHYHRVLVYDRKGELLTTYGGDEGTGSLVGRFGYVADVEVDSLGNLYVAESQNAERISKISPGAELLTSWGSLGSEPGQFQRIRAMVFGPDDRLYVADACNHRIQIFDTNGKFLSQFGRAGSAPGEMMYPYDLALAKDGTLFVCEYGNSRVQRFNSTGESLGTWGRPGRGVGEFWNPWALALDPQERLYVVDSNNHRIQRLLWK